MGDRPQASLPGLGDGGLGDRGRGDSIGDRRNDLSDRLGGGDRGDLGQDRLGNRDDRQQTRNDRQEGRQDTRGDRQQTRNDRQEGRQDTRGDRQETRNDRQEGRQETRGDRQENRQEQRADRQGTRQENRADRQQSWQEQRDEIRQDWQDYRDQAREDWQGWLEDNYGMYGDWYGGYAPGYWGQWDSLWDNYPVAAVAGLTWWGANALGSLFGYSDYTNPYYAESMPAYYTEPILAESYYSSGYSGEPATVTVTTEQVQQAAPVTQTQGGPAAAAQAPGVSSEGLSNFDQAREAFFAGHYEQALKLTDAAVAQMPRDAVLHEFRSLVLFALGRYAEAAATIHPVLDVGPGWDWKTLSSLYPSTDVYTQQLRALEAARDKAPKAADLRFLLGYHYLTCGYNDQALTEFRRTLELQPNDAVAASLVATLSPRDAQAAQAAPAEPAATAKAVPPDSVVGNWTAAGKDKSKYSMSLRKDGSFTWGFTKGKRKQEVKGVHTVEDNVLAMEPDSGGVLLAELTLKDPDTLHFKMIGGASGDPGLEFRRQASKQ
jgi:Flp pilus assembly protein TadD